MSSSYPGSLDSFTNPTSGDSLSTSVGGRTHSAMHSDLNDAIENIEAELGVNPSGSDATVVARLDRIEAAPTYTTVTSFSNSWVQGQGPGTSYPPVSYAKDSVGFVHLRGYVQSGTSFQTAFTLPAGFRPQYKMGGVGFEVQTSGAIVMTTSGATDMAQIPPFAAYS